ncbi:uncharacterized protein LOC134654470 [Cydia amplana]|uniref:uncharacterized protein LOC134654470 n=1 Tax=Cydia amplana TaxID=1869771 RepID=UPI002FE6C4B2
MGEGSVQNSSRFNLDEKESDSESCASEKSLSEVENGNELEISDYNLLSSNVHNLSLLVDEVKKYGILQSFNAYPFENKLFCIKKMVRQGNKALQQVARRINEMALVDIDREPNKSKNSYKVSNIKCKLVSVLLDTNLYFVPLLHTL